MSTGQLALRALWVTTSAVITAVALVGFIAWLALQIRWEVPDAAALTAPTVIRASDGTVLTRLTSELDRRIITLDQVSPAARDAVVASEDVRFYEHQGVDPLALLRAIISNVRTGAIRQGGSTLTQQYVKNAFTGAERTIARKIREAVISIQLERDIGKEAILERYLNAVYFGEGAYGIEAAALTFFGVHASELTAAQGAALAQALPAPSRWNARVDPVGARIRRDTVIERMGEAGFLSPPEAAHALASPLEVRPRQPQPVLHPFFVEYVKKQLIATYGEELVLTGGLDVTTTIDPRTQEVLAAAVAEHLPPETAPIDAGVVALDPRTGDIRGAYSGRDFAASQYDLALQGVRQPGSTFKTFVYVAALEQGVSPQRRYRAPGRITLGDWKVSGGRGGASTTISQGLIHSVNTVYAQLGVHVGAEHIAQVASRMGVRSPRLSDSDVTIALGSREISVLDMASAYGTLANDGVACPARSIRSVRAMDGTPLPLPQERPPDPAVIAERPEGLGERDDGRCYEALDADIARTTTETLQQVVARGTGTRADIGRPQAGKTGTSQENRDAWFAGYTPQLSLAVWIGHPKEQRELRYIAGFDTVFGGTIPALIWRDAAEALLADVEPTDFPKPGDLVPGRRRVANPAMTRHPSVPESSPTVVEATDGPTADGTAEPSPPDGYTPSPVGPSPSDDGGGGAGGGDGPCIPFVRPC